MIHYSAPHEVKDQEKLAQMVATLEAGESLPPIVVMGYTAITGSHRIAAYENVGEEPEAVEVTVEDYRAAMSALWLDPDTDDIKDYSAFCDALYKLTSDATLKAALEDQRE